METRLLKFHKYRIQCKIPLDWLEYYIGLIDNLVCKLNDYKLILHEKALRQTYEMIGKYQAAQTASMALFEVLWVEWSWQNVWHRFV
jgi:hypothetical protein